MHNATHEILYEICRLREWTRPQDMEPKSKLVKTANLNWHPFHILLYFIRTLHHHGWGLWHPESVLFDTWSNFCLNQACNKKIWLCGLGNIIGHILEIELLLISLIVVFHTWWDKEDCNGMFSWAYRDQNFCSNRVILVILEKWVYIYLHIYVIALWFSGYGAWRLVLKPLTSQHSGFESRN